MGRVALGSLSGWQLAINLGLEGRMVFAEITQLTYYSIGHLQMIHKKMSVQYLPHVLLAKVYSLILDNSGGFLLILSLPFSCKLFHNQHSKESLQDLESLSTP